MENKSSVIHQAVLMLLFITWWENIYCVGLKVDPPEDIVVVDPGHLGRLEITWSPPSSLINMTHCQKLYQLEYFNTYQDSWTAIRTTQRSYSAQFDQMKDVRVRVYTVLSGPCTNGTMVKSESYSELVQKPPSTGVVGTEVKDFICVFYNMENMECEWKRNPKLSAAAQQNLYFWHKKLKRVEECPKYIISRGIRIGCNFSGKALPEFTDINLCLNGSSPHGPLKPTFISLQTQNQVKPGTTERLHLQTGPNAQLEIHWERPAGNVPAHCLEWEVEHNKEEPDGKTELQILTKQTSLNLQLVHGSERHCVRVRSKLNMYCADSSFWSEWSRLICHPERKEPALEPEWDKVQVYICIAFATSAIVLLSLCVGTILKTRRSRDEKGPGSRHFSTLCL
ncbi:interleukin-13 receptor subunit alpha-2 isoform X1 [Solea solea]|uniref:interleukin-13 receptor subunit alpha-2 isoform X1 n=1 Tax=Solea solea TaxID=90069 RepID=UPI002729D9D7|nr:interleukin-13 receptor subunit alpha-2 isoform X1 [Solea solea]